MLSKAVAALTVVFLLLIAVPASAQVPPAVCERRPNNTTQRLLECVTVEGVREHQTAFQETADANGGTRVSGFDGYNDSADYVATTMRRAGYRVTIQEFEFIAFIPLGPLHPRTDRTGADHVCRGRGLPTGTTDRAGRCGRTRDATISVGEFGAPVYPLLRSGPPSPLRGDGC